jgi:predicted alpha/beta-hydrolase family hydrolase
MPERIELGPCAALRHDGDPDRCAVLLPGQFYPTRAPVLWFAREAVAAQGWSALEILGEPGEHPDPLDWERRCAESALAHTGDARMLVIGNSLASLLAAEVSDRGLSAAWLTPLLTEAAVTDALARTESPTLLMGGTEDRLWRRDAIPENPALEVLELPGADHSLQRRGDPHANLDALRKVADAVARLASQ